MTTTQHAAGWVPVHREDDELIGFVSEEVDGWQPRTVFGYPVGDVAGQEAAVERLHAVGMSYLAEKWELRVGADWISAQIVEASPAGVTVQLVDFFDHADRYGERQVLTAPVGPDALRPA